MTECHYRRVMQQRKVAGEVIGAEREKEIVLEAERLEIRDKAPLVLAELLYDTNIIAQIKQHRTLFCRVCISYITLPSGNQPRSRPLT